MTAQSVWVLVLGIFVGLTPSLMSGESKIRLITFNETLGKIQKGIVADGIIISSDAKRVAQVVATDNKWSVIINDEASAFEYDGIGRDSVHFSADSTRIGFVAIRGEKKLVVIDDKESPEYENIAQGSPIFSPNSKRSCYVALKDGKFVIVVDDIQMAKYDGLDKSGPIFSPDSRRIGYAAKKGERWVAVVDGIEGHPYDGIDNLIFSPDSQHFAYIALLADKIYVVVDGIETGKYDALLNGSRLVFDSPTRLHILALKDRYIIRSEILIAPNFDHGSAPPETAE